MLCRQACQGTPDIGAVAVEQIAQGLFAQLGSRRQPLLGDGGQDGGGNCLLRRLRGAGRIIF